MTNKEAIEWIAHDLKWHSKELKPQYKTALNVAIKALKEQERNRWIPVSERLPEEHETMFAKYKGTNKWNKSMFEKVSDDVNATVEFEDGTRKTMTKHTTDGEWKENFSIVKKKVVAWKPLPEPYKESEEK